MGKQSLGISEMRRELEKQGDFSMISSHLLVVANSLRSILLKLPEIFLTYP